MDGQIVTVKVGRLDVALDLRRLSISQLNYLLAKAAPVDAVRIIRELYRRGQY